METFGSDFLKRFTEKTGIDVSVNTSASEAAVFRMMNGYSHVAGSMKGLRHNKPQGQYIEIPFCKDNLAVIGNVGIGVNNLSEQDLQKIFTRSVTNWKEVGGADQKITVVVPGRDTAAYQNFREQVMKGEKIVHDFMAAQSSDVIDAVRTMQGSVSFITQGAVVANKGAVKKIRINSYSPKDTEYPYFQTMYFITKKEHGNAVEKLINFYRNEDGRKIMENYSMIPISE
ncbi:MAG: substrate-binding domain-containing protein [Desulfococcaceae bacterium]|nr:substrate-binding domain-containing protein [Desulfococcaceae bacterium]